MCVCVRERERKRERRERKKMCVCMSERKIIVCKNETYSVFHRFRQAKFPNGGSILSSNQFSILPQPPQKMKLASKVVKIDPKIIVLLPKI